MTTQEFYQRFCQFIQGFKTFGKSCEDPVHAKLCDPIQVEVINPGGEISPSDEWSALFDGLGNQIVASIDAQTQALSDVIIEACEKKLEALQSIDDSVSVLADILNAGINVTATQDGEWVVSIDGELELAANTIAAIENAIANALADANVDVTIANEPLEVVITGNDGVITVELGQATLDALQGLEVNATITGQDGPIEVVGNVNALVDGIVQIDWSDVPTLNVNTGLEDLLLTVTLSGEEVNVNLEELIEATNAITEEIKNTVRVDKEYRPNDLCVIGQDGKKVPLTGVFDCIETRYDNAGNPIGTTQTTVLSRFTVTTAGSSWVAYTLGAGQTVGECPSCEKSVQCWKDKFVEGGLDNTFTVFRDTNQEYVVTFDNGDTDTFSIPSATGWTDQVTQMSQGLSSVMPWAQTVEPFCTTGCGGLPSPQVELNSMLFRLVGFRVCPGDKVPVQVSYKSDQREVKALVLQYVETDTIYLDRCVSCCGDSEYTIVDTKEPYEPVCAIPCPEDFPQTPVTNCQFFPPVNGCDNGTEPPTPIVAIYSDCGNGLETAYLIDDGDGGLESYDLLGTFVDCTTGEVVPEPEPENDQITDLITAIYDLIGSPDDECPCSNDCGKYDTEYQVVAGNTDIDFSSSSTEMKWNLSSGGNEQGAKDFTEAMKACIDNNGTATVTKVDDENGDTFEFVANAYSGAAPNYLFSGEGTTTGVGKVVTATLKCNC